MKTLLLAGLLFGCASSTVRRPGSPQPPPTETEAGAIAPRLHLVARGTVDGEVLPTNMTLCPIEGAVFVCGGTTLPIVRDRDIVVDSNMVRGLVLDRAWIGAVMGRWPDAAWLRVDEIWNHHTFYRWTVDRWEPVLPTVQVEHAALIPRRSGPLEVLRRGPAESWIEFAAPYGGTLPTSFQTDCFHLGDDDFVAFDDDVVILQQSLSTSRLRRVGAITTEIPVIEGSHYRAIKRYRDHLVAVGDRNEQAVVDMRVGTSWVTVDLTALGSIGDYARDEDAEWATTFESVVVRSGGTRVRRIALPGVNAERVWLPPGDGAWVMGKRDGETLLFHTTAPSRVAQLTYQF